MNVAYLVTKDNVTVSRDGKTLMVGKQYSTFNGIIDKLKAQDFDGAFELADKATALTKQSNGAFEVKSGVVYRNGLPVHNVVTDRIIQFQEQGLPFEPMVKFLENLMSNPSSRAVTELYTFLENKNLPVTEDGCFLAYKSVQQDYLSITSGTTKAQVTTKEGVTYEATGKLPNVVGNILEVERNAVDDDASRTCSYGLHAGAIEYVEGFGGSNKKVVVVKINPRDVVSIPLDCDAQKLRTARYEVIADFKSAITEPLVNTEPEPKDSYHNVRDNRGRFTSKK